MHRGSGCFWLKLGDAERANTAQFSGSGERSCSSGSCLLRSGAVLLAAPVSLGVQVGPAGPSAAKPRLQLEGIRERLLWVLSVLQPAPAFSGRGSSSRTPETANPSDRGASVLPAPCGTPGWLHLLSHVQGCR